MPSEFESFLDERLGPSSDQLDRRARRVASLSRRLTQAVRVGDMRAAEAALRDLQGLPVEEPLTAAAEAAAGFDYRTYLAGGFDADFQAACREAGVPLEGYFPNYFVFPFPVRVDTENLSVVINRKRVGMLRPSSLVGAVREERERLERSPFNAGEFIGILFAVWSRMNAQASAQNKLDVRQPQPLKLVYKDLVPFARWRREYPESFFAYDLQRLLTSDVLIHEGWQCILERGRASGNAIRLVDRDGQERLISTVSFVQVGE